jgi:hypothetical protein
MKEVSLVPCIAVNHADHTNFSSSGGGQFLSPRYYRLKCRIALLLPLGAKQFLTFWSRVEQDRISIIVIEMVLAVVLIGCFSYIRRSWRDRVLAKAQPAPG